VQDGAHPIALRNEVVARLFREQELACHAIAALTWRAVVRQPVSPSLRKVLRTLRTLERYRGHGGSDSHVVRFHGASDPVVRANAVLRLVRGTCAPVNRGDRAATAR
jgi:hypothetical protein